MAHIAYTALPWQDTARTLRLTKQAPRHIKTMSKSTLSFIIAGAALVLAFVLNPSADKHRATIKETVAERSPLAGALGVGSLTAFASNYHSLGVASYTTAGERTISVGMFGMVFVLQQK